MAKVLTIEGKVFDNIADILALPEKKFVILGEVGAGKSTLLKYMMHAIATNDYETVGKEVIGMTPIFIDLIEYAEVLEKSRSKLPLIHFICEGEAGRFGLLFDHELQHHNCVVLLDGLVPTAGK